MRVVRVQPGGGDWILSPGRPWSTRQYVHETRNSLTSSTRRVLLSITSVPSANTVFVVRSRKNSRPSCGDVGARSAAVPLCGLRLPVRDGGFAGGKRRRRISGRKTWAVGVLNTVLIAERWGRRTLWTPAVNNTGRRAVARTKHPGNFDDAPCCVVDLLCINHTVDPRQDTHSSHSDH